MKSNDYLERRGAINEAVLRDVVALMASHFPATQHQLGSMYDAWNAAIDKLDADIPGTVEEPQKGSTT